MVAELPEASQRSACSTDSLSLKMSLWLWILYLIKWSNWLTIMPRCVLSASCLADLGLSGRGDLLYRSRLEDIGISPSITTRTMNLVVTPVAMRLALIMQIDTMLVWKDVG